MYGPRVRARRNLAHDGAAHRDGSRERHAGDARIAHELFADLGAGAVHVVERARGQSRVADAVGEEPARPGRVGGALEHDGVARDERGGGRPGGERDREIERRDHGPDTVRTHHALVARNEDGRRIVRQVELVALVGFEVVRVNVEEVHALLRLAERLEPVLADFERERGRDVVHALLEEAGDLAHERDARRHAGIAPGRGGALRLPRSRCPLPSRSRAGNGRS